MEARPHRQRDRSASVDLTFLEMSVMMVWFHARVCLTLVGSSYRLTNMLPNAPDMSQLKLGVRSVAGKLSVMASGVVNTIQVRSRTAHHPKHLVFNKLLFQ